MKGRSKVTLASALADVAEETGAFVDAAAGYRARCVEAGFTEESAEKMALTYHGMLVAYYRSAATRQAGAE